MSSTLALSFKTLDKLAVWLGGFRWHCCWTLWTLYFPSTLPCSSVMTDSLWSCPAKKHVAKIKLGCVLRMALSCLRERKQVYLMGLLWSLQFLLEVSPSVSLCASPFASSCLPFPSFSSLRKHEKGPKTSENSFFAECALVMKSKNWMAALGYSLSSEALSLQRAFLVTRWFKAALLKLSSLSLNTTLSDWLL